MTERAARQQRIAVVLRRERIASQRALARRLRAEGIRATQGTLSRDLRELGVLKGPGGYLLPGDGQGERTRAGASGPVPGASLERRVREYLVSAERCGALVVLRTGPGHAQPLALEIDRAALPGVLGTIAGDDTVFVAAASDRRAASLAARLRALGRADAGPARRRAGA